MKDNLFIQFYKDQSFTVLLFMLILLILIGPLLSMSYFAQHRLLSDIIWTGAFSIVLLFSYLAMQQNPYLPKLALTLCVLAILSQLIKVVFPNITLLVTHHLMGIIYMLFVIVFILHLMFTTRTITTNIISASLCLYLLLAVIWSQAYSMLELVEPGAFNIQFDTHDDFLLGRSVAPLYFSLVTITTLGYGDIVPVTQSARMMAVVEAFIGQLYIAVLVARLVGMHVKLPKSSE